ncbi:hypothetical protein PQO03_13090 [Lentisphaera profundi]|uniref:Toluene tolerance protein n=1 Tax=Lentisphaera profundi TaxID=1658616 RepID=A0ABY7W0X8_9BACT|nr:hypothetical protein [Lentisphaera profundi]WDE98772.1 hypothetical protein PQO03_13090 [Lentisphaera profundi]
MNINEISEMNFQQFRSQSKLIEETNGFEKVFLYENKYIIKIFRHRKLISTSRLKNKAKQFQDNALTLEKCNIAAAKVIKKFKLKSPEKRYGLVYNYLEGETFYDTYKEASRDSRDSLLKNFFNFFKLLHKKGIYFRSAHLANIIVQTDGSFALIDIDNIQFYKRALSIVQIFRNFKAILRRKEDYEIFKEIGLTKILHYYFGNDAPPSFGLLICRWKSHPLHQLSKNKKY